MTRLASCARSLRFVLIAHIVDQEPVEPPLVVGLGEERSEAGRETRLEGRRKVVLAPHLGGERLRLRFVAVRELTDASTARPAPLCVFRP